MKKNIRKETKSYFRAKQCRVGIELRDNKLITRGEKKMMVLMGRKKRGRRKKGDRGGAKRSRKEEG